MTKKVLDEVFEAVEKSLPSMQVAALRDALNERDALGEALDNQRLSTEYWEDQYNAKSELYNNVREDNARFKNELEEAYNRINELEIQQRDAELAALRAEVKATNDTTDKFLKNTVYRESLQHQIIAETPNIQYQFQNGYNNPVNMGVNKTPTPVVDNKEQTTE